MKVRMKEQILGTRDGVAWPPAGGEIELPDHEAKKLCAAGSAVPVDSSQDDVEKRKRKPAAKRTSSKQ